MRHESHWLSNLLGWVVPFALLFLFWTWMGKRMSGAAGSLVNIGNRVKIHDDTLPKVTFEQVAGVEQAKEELQESIEFLKDRRVSSASAAICQRARAVSGETRVPLFNISGTEFIGGPVMMGGHDEREQTLNQLLTEMDGFDRQIVADKPHLAARQQILRLHAGKLTLAPDVDLGVVAQRTPSFVGADLANIACQAAILAVRHNHEAVTTADFAAAIDRVIAGPEKKHRVLNIEQKRRVVHHESGHALVALTAPTGEPVQKVSIIPRGVAALGLTLQLPVAEKVLSTENELKDQLAILLGGRVAEEIVFGDVSSGASNDLERASEIARDMVTRPGMSEQLGPLGAALAVALSGRRL